MSSNSGSAGPPAIGGRTIVIAIVALAFFALLTTLVHIRALSGLDLAFTRATQAFASQPLDRASAIFNVAFSIEVSLLLGLAGALYLWQRGLGVWSLAPLSFLLLAALEMALKLTIQQPPVPPEFRRPTEYPLLTIALPGSFPSGHAIRTAFFCLFAALLLRSRRTPSTAVAASLLIALLVVVAFTRVYLGQHWLSDVVGGAVLGAGLAQLLVSPVIGRLTGRAT